HVTTVGTGGSNFAEFVADDVFGNDNRDMLTTVVYCDGQTDHLRQNHGPARPGLDWLAVVLFCCGFDLLQQVKIDKRTFLQRTRHVVSPLLLAATTDNHVVCALVGPSLGTLGGEAPRRHRMTTTRSTPFTTTMRVVDRVHGDTTNGRTYAAPASGTGLAQGAQAVLTIGRFAQGGAALAEDLAHLAGTQANGDIGTFTGYQLNGCTGTAGNLSTLAGLQLDRVDSATHRNVAQRQTVARLDRRFGTVDQLIASNNTTGGDDVATLAIGILQQSNMSGTVRIVFDALNGGRDAILVATKIDQTIVLLVTAPTMTRGNAAIVVTTTGLALLLQQRCIGSTLVQVRVNDLSNEAAASGSRFTFNNCHDVPLSYSALA